MKLDCQLDVNTVSWTCHVTDCWAWLGQGLAGAAVTENGIPGLNQWQQEVSCGSLRALGSRYCLGLGWEYKSSGVGGDSDGYC